VGAAEKVQRFYTASSAGVVVVLVCLLLTLSPMAARANVSKGDIAQAAIGYF
jgi:hypothetical protein